MNLGNALSGAQSFLFGPGSDAPTYESLKRKREIADLLAQQSIGGEYRNWGDGVGGVLKALGYRLMDNKLGPQEDAERQRIADILGGLGGGSPVGAIGGAPGGFTGAGVPDTVSSMGAAPALAGTPVAPTAANPYRDAIASIESAGSGDYSAMGPVTKSGDRAYGRYQVMGANIPDWSQAAIGRAVTPEEFVVSPEIQDAVFDHRFGGYVDQYGPAGAASMWFSGDPTPDGSSDGYMADTAYVDRFMGALGGGGGMGMGGQPDMARVGQLADVLSNPYATDGQKMVAQALIERELAAGGGMDPYQAARLGLDYQRLQLDRDKFAQGTREGPRYYGSVQWAERPNPETGEMELAPYQVGSDGNVNWLDLGGAQPLPPTRSADLGTTIAPVGPGGKVVAEPLVKDVAGAAAQKEVGASAGQAAAGLGDREIAVTSAIDQIGRIVANPALPGITGAIQGRIPPLSQAGTDLAVEIEGLGGKVFNQAIDALRGLGAMTEREGEAARQALANLSRLQSDEAMRAELGRLAQLLTDKLEVARAKAAQVGGATAAPAAGGGIPPSAAAAGIDPDLWQFMSPEDQALWRN